MDLLLIALAVFAAVFAFGALAGALAGHALITIGRCVVGCCDCERD